MEVSDATITWLAGGGATAISIAGGYLVKQVRDANKRAADCEKGRRRDLKEWILREQEYNQRARNVQFLTEDDDEAMG